MPQRQAETTGDNETGSEELRQVKALLKDATAP
jgi:hypothetical protein